MKEINLTPKQESFCNAIASGKSQIDSYRAAYDAGKMKDATIANNAYKLMQNNDITTRISAIKKTLENKLLWTKEMSVKALIQAFKEGAPSVKVSAVKELNIMHGYNAPTEISIDQTLELTVVRAGSEL